MEELKQQKTAKSHRVKRYTSSQNQIEQNQLFTVNKKAFSWSSTYDGAEQTLPNFAGVTAFWLDMWGAPMDRPPSHNEGAS